MNENTIKHFNEFERILNNYKPSIEVIDLLNQLNLVLLIAPAAAGRNTIISTLVMTGKYYYLRSDTTRKPRINNGVPERNGEEYWFRDEIDFLDNLKRGDYIGPAIIHNQQASGISIHEIREALLHQLITITDVDIQGSDYLRDYAPEAMNIFVLPPSFEEWMKRMDERGHMNPAEKRRRLQSATKEISGALERDYFKFVTNWDLRSTSEELHEEISSGDFGPSIQQEAKKHAEELLSRLHQELN